jgi:hypothetical protein
MERVYQQAPPSNSGALAVFSRAAAPLPALSLRLLADSTGPGTAEDLPHEAACSTFNSTVALPL